MDKDPSTLPVKAQLNPRRSIWLGILLLLGGILACNAPTQLQPSGSATADPIRPTASATPVLGQPPTLPPIRLQGTPEAEDDVGLIDDPRNDDIIRTQLPLPSTLAAAEEIERERDPEEFPENDDAEDGALFALPPTATLNPIIPSTLNPPTATPEGRLDFVYTIEWSISESDPDLAIGVVVVEATGGDETYRYFWNDRETEDSQFTIEVDACSGLIASLRVSTGDGQRINRVVTGETPCAGNINP